MVVLAWVGDVHGEYNVTVDDASPLIIYADSTTESASGGWVTYDRSNIQATDRGSYNSTLHTSYSSTARMAFTFTGTAVYLFGPGGPSHFEVGVFGSEVGLTSVVTFPERLNGTQLLYSVVGLKNSPHSLVVRNRDVVGLSRLSIDYVVVTVPGDPPSQNRMSNSSSPASSTSQGYPVVLTAPNASPTTKNNQNVQTAATPSPRYTQTVPLVIVGTVVGLGALATGFLLWFIRSLFRDIKRTRQDKWIEANFGIVPWGARDSIDFWNDSKKAYSTSKIELLPSNEVVRSKADRPSSPETISIQCVPTLTTPSYQIPEIKVTGPEQTSHGTVKLPLRPRPTAAAVARQAGLYDSWYGE